MGNYTRGFLREEDLAPSSSITENLLRMVSPIRIANALAPVARNQEGNFEFALPSAIADPMESWKGMVDRHRGGIQDDEADARDAFNVAGSVGIGSVAAAPLKPSNALGAMGSGIAKNRNAIAPAIQAGDTSVSTRFPTGKTAPENPLTHHLTIGLDEFKNSPAFEHNVSLLSSYPGYGRLAGMAPEEAAQAYINQSADNLVWLYNNSPEVIKQRSPLWYDGANRISNALAERYGIPRQSVSGAIANLSPQKDWFMNMSLAERVGDTLFGPAASKRMTPEMLALGKSLSAINNSKTNSLAFKKIQGKRLSELTDPIEQAMWIRLYDETNNPRSFRSITPEGDYGDFIVNQDGSLSSAAWGSFPMIAKAVKAYQSGGDMNIISPTLGDMHKVRSFYNNIEVPNDPIWGDVTADTHQVAAAQLRPLSQSSPEVSHNFGTGLEKDKQPLGYVGARSSSLDGVQGTYALTAEATRRAAKELGMIPRQAQSGTWEPVRELFTSGYKSSKNTNAVDDVWKAYDRGDITINEAREHIYDLAGGIGRPEWAMPNLRVYDPTRYSTYR